MKISGKLQSQLLNDIKIAFVNGYQLAQNGENKKAYDEVIWNLKA
jgi:hypothetical protein